MRTASSASSIPQLATSASLWPSPGLIVALVFVGSVDAVVAGIAETIAVAVGLVSVFDGQAVVVGVFDAIIVIIVGVLIGVTQVGAGNQHGRRVVAPAALFWGAASAEAIVALIGWLVLAVGDQGEGDNAGEDCQGD